MPFSIIAAGLGASADMGIAALDRNHQIEMANLNAKYAEQQARRDYDRQLDFWNQQNAYNDPSAQVERLEKAGLNPNAILSGGGLQNVAGSAPATPTNQLAQRGKYPVGNFALPNLGDQVVKMTQAVKNLKDAKKADQELKNLEGEYGLIMSEQRLTDARAVTEQYNAEYQKQLGISQKIQNEIAEATKSDDITLKQNAVKQSYKIIDKLGEEINNLKSSTSFNKANERYTDSKTATEAEVRFNLIEQRRQIAYQCGLLQVQQELARHNINLTDAQVEKVYTDIWTNTMQTDIQMQQWEIDSQTRGAQNAATLANTKMNTRMGYVTGISSAIGVAVKSTVDILSYTSRNKGRNGLSAGDKIGLVKLGLALMK